MGRRLLPALLAAALLASACSKGEPGRPRLAAAGKPAPEISLPKLVNAPFRSLSGWEQLKGKAVVLEFWASWCDPCVDNIPHLNELAARYKDKPVVFISVTDESSSDVEAFLSGHRMDGWIAPEAGQDVFRAFRVYGRPHTVLIGRDGAVKAFTYPSDVTPQTVDELLAGTLPPDEGPEAGLHADEDADPDPSVLGEFYLARSSGTSTLRYRLDHFSARAVTLRTALDFLLGSPDQVDAGPGTAGLLDAVYDIRLVAPTSGPDRKPELFLKGLAFSTGLKASMEYRDADVYALRRVAGADPLKRAAAAADAAYDGVTLKASGSSFDVLAGRLGERLGRPVLDETGDKGPFSYSFVFDTREARVADAELRRLLGLRLDLVRRRIKVLKVRK